MNHFGSRSALLVAVAATVTTLANLSAEEPQDAQRRLFAAIDATEWIYAIDSAQIEATITITRPAEVVDAERAKFVEEWGGSVPEETLQRASWLLPESEGHLHLAWDRKRMVYRIDFPECSTDVTIWDGEKGMSHDRSYVYRQDFFALTPKPSETLSGHFFSWLPWSLTGEHYSPIQVDAIDAESVTRARNEKKKRLGSHRPHSTTDLEGRACRLFASPEVGDWDRYYVDLQTGRLRGCRFGSFGRVWEKVSFPIIQRGLAAEGIQVNDYAEAEGTLTKMNADDRKLFFDKIQPATELAHWDHLPEYDEAWTILLDDWREVLPGRRFPFLQVHRGHQRIDERVIESEFRLITINRFDTNFVLDDQQFQMDIEEGAAVYDGTRDPPLRYQQDRNRSQEEWDELIRKAKEEQEEDRAETAALDDLKGKPAAPLPVDDWVNSDPLSWESLSGCYVILEFWHIHCGPCWDQVGWMQALHKRRDEPDGVTVIGIHGAGVNAESIRHELGRRLQVPSEFPICIDRSSNEAETGSFPSLLFGQFRVRRMPYAWLVGPDGNLIDHGRLPTLLEQARKLKKSQKTSVPAQ